MLLGVIFVTPELSTVSTIDAGIEEQIGSIDGPAVDSPSNDIPTSTKQAIDYDAWYLGESVKTNIEFNKQPISLPFESYYLYLGENPDFYYYNIQESLVDDEDIMSVSAWRTDGHETSDGEAYYYFKIYCGGAGELFYEFYMSFGYYDDTVYTLTQTSEKVSDYSIGASKLDNEGYLHLYFFVEHSDVSAWCRLFIYDSTGETAMQYGFVGGKDIDGCRGFTIQIDYLYFLRDTIDNNIRSYHNYASATTMINRKTIPSVPHAKEINVNLMTDETVTSVNPSASWSITSNVLTIASPTELDYEVFSSRNCSNILGIEDKSTDYLFDIGFEKNEFLTDWHFLSTFNIAQTATDIVSEKYRSLHLVESSQNDAHLMGKVSESSIEGYISFDFYRIDMAGTEYYKFLIYDEVSDSWVDLAYLHTYSADSWHKLFFYVHLKYDPTYDRQFQFSLGDSGRVCNFYIDNFRFSQTSTTISTQGYSDHLITLMMTAWNGYENPPMPFEEVTIELWDRTAQTLEYSYITTTDENGIATWNFEQGFEQKEYELRTYSLNSYFGSEQTQTDVTNSVADWTLNNEDVGTETFTCVDSTLIFEFRESGAENWEIYYNPSSTFDISSADILYYTYRSNVTSRLNYKWIKTDASNHILNVTDTEFTANIIYHFKDSFRHADYAETGTFDDASVDIFYHRANFPTGWIKVEIFDFRFINAQKFYFTPSYASEIDFAETELLDAWDFSEGDNEGWDAFTYCSALGVYNGYYDLRHTYDSADYFSVYSQNELGANSDYYTNFVIRAKISGVEAGIDWKFYLVYYTPDFDYQAPMNHNLTEEWQTFVFNSEAGKTIDRVRLYITNWQDDLTSDVDFQFDFARLVHKDSRLPNTNDYATDELYNAWDFSEGDTDDWVTLDPAVDEVYENGIYYMITNPSISQTYIYTDYDSTVSVDASHYTHFAMRFRTNVTICRTEGITNGEIYFYDAHWGNMVLDIKGWDDCGLGTGNWGGFLANKWYEFVIEIDNAEWTGTETDFQILFSNASTTFQAWTMIEIEYIYLIHQEELLYSTIQNSILLESDTNDLLYEVWMDHNYIGSFPDLSLIPLIQTVGTHYFQVSPYRTNGDYLTVVYSWYYTVEASAFSVSLESFYVTDFYVNTFVTSNYDGNYIVYEDGGSIDSGTLHKEGTTIITNRDVTVGASINYTIAFTYGSEMIPFKTYYNNPSSDFFVTSYSVDIDTTITVTWDTSKNTIDSLTIIEDGSTKVTDDSASPTTWTKSTVAGTHVVTLIFEATDYNDIIWSFTYVVGEVPSFSVQIQDFYITDNYVNTYFVANYAGTYIVYENDGQIATDSFGTSPLTISTVRDLTPSVKIDYSISFDDGVTVIWFNTTYQNAISDYYLTNFALNQTTTDIDVYWNASIDWDYATYELGDAWDFEEGDTETLRWQTNNPASVTVVDGKLRCEATAASSYDFYVMFEPVLYPVGDNYVFFVIKVRSNIAGNVILFSYTGTPSWKTYASISTYDDEIFRTEIVSLSYQSSMSSQGIRFRFRTNAANFEIGDYFEIEFIKILKGQVTVIEDGVEIVSDSLDYPVTWTKSTIVGTHHFSIVFECANYKPIIYQFEYIVSPIPTFYVNVENFYVSDDYLNLYCTSNYDYSYTAWTNGSESGTGNGLAVGTFLILPKTREAGLYNFTIEFAYDSETVIFMTWYSNLIPPLHPLNDLYREQSQGFYNITFLTNLEFYWIDIYHDDVLIFDDSTETQYSISKALKVGWHNITLNYIYNCSTNADGYPVTEYNVTIPYEFWYETKLFFDVRIRYVPIDYIGLMIGDEFEVSWVHTYLDSVLIFDGEIDYVPDYSNYTFISNDYIRIKNSMPIHNLVVTDLFNRLILNTTIDLSNFTYEILKLPVYKMGFINNDIEKHKIGVKLFRTSEDWQRTPILPPGYQKEYWVKMGTYDIRVYSVGTVIYGQSENETVEEFYDEYEDHPAQQVPFYFEIPLTIDVEPEEEVVEEKNWRNTILGIVIATLVVLVIVSVAIYRAIKKKGVFIKK